MSMFMMLWPLVTWWPSSSHLTPSHSDHIRSDVTQTRIKLRNFIKLHFFYQHYQTCISLLDILTCLVCAVLTEIFSDETILLISITNTQSHKQIDKDWRPRGNGVSWPKTELSRYQQVGKRNTLWSLACYYKANRQENSFTFFVLFWGEN